MADQQMLAAANNIVKNLGSIYTALSNAFVGQASVNKFTMAAAATKTVTDGNVTATSYVVLFPLNAAAGTLRARLSAFTRAAASGEALRPRRRAAGMRQGRSFWDTWCSTSHDRSRTLNAENLGSRGIRNA